MDRPSLQRWLKAQTRRRVQSAISLKHDKQLNIQMQLDFSLALTGEAREECRDMRGLNSIENLARDVRFAVRQLRKNPGFTLTAVLMLALGVGARVSIFSFVDAALIERLPDKNPERLVGVLEETTMCPLCNVSYLNFLDWKRDDRLFSSLDLWNFSSYLLHAPTGAQPAMAARVSDREGNRHCSHVASLAHEIGDDPVIFSLLQLIPSEPCEFRPPESRSEKHGDNGIVTFTA